MLTRRVRGRSHDGMMAICFFAHASPKLAFIYTGHGLLADHAVMKKNQKNLPVACHYIIYRSYLIGCVLKGHQPKWVKVIVEI